MDRIFPVAFFSLMFGTLIAGHVLATETEYKMRECLHSGSHPEECKLKYYGR